jgi:hypothetical protein
MTWSTSASTRFGTSATTSRWNAHLGLVAVEHPADASDPHPLVEELLPAKLHPLQQRVDGREPRLELAQHLSMKRGELTVDVLDRAQIVGQQLQPHAFLGVERLYQERLERREPARHERGVVTSLTGAHRGVPTAREPAGRYRARSRRAPVAYLLQEPALALRERPVGRRHEDDQVAARGEVAPWTYRS